MAARLAAVQLPEGVFQVAHRVVAEELLRRPDPSADLVPEHVQAGRAEPVLERLHGCPCGRDVRVRSWGQVDGLGELGAGVIEDLRGEDVERHLRPQQPSWCRPSK